MKRVFCIFLAVVMLLSLCACTNNETKTTTAAPDSTEKAPEESAKMPEESAKTPETGAEPASRKAFNIYSLKGPTTMGLVTLLRDSLMGKTENEYKPTLCTAADEVTAALVNGDADIALLPANAAAALFNKAGGFSVVGINTLGVLYMLENGKSVQSMDDLAGKTVFLTGKGTTPEYALRYLLSAHGIEDQVTLEFKSEAQEVVEAMAQNTAAIGVLPQPFATAAQIQNDGLRQALNLTEEWAAVTQDSILVTGVTVVRNEILEQYPLEIALFLKEAAQGVENVNKDPKEAAKIIAELGIVAKAPIAEKALPFCNLVSITGTEMKTLLSGYLQTLFDQNPKAVGGTMPADNFYYTGFNYTGE